MSVHDVTSVLDLDLKRPGVEGVRVQYLGRGRPLRIEASAIGIQSIQGLGDLNPSGSVK